MFRLELRDWQLPVTEQLLQTICMTLHIQQQLPQPVVSEIAEGAAGDSSRDGPVEMLLARARTFFARRESL